MSFRSKRKLSRVVTGQVNVCGSWHRFRAVVCLSDATHLAADIRHISPRHKAAEVVGRRPSELPTCQEDIEDTYKRLEPKVKHRLAHPKKRGEEPIVVQHEIPRSDFIIEAVHNCI